MFAGNRKGLRFQMKDGDKVVVTGSVEVFERDGVYQIYARKIELDGAGNLYLKFEQLKQELEEMGMFAEEYKQPIPKYAHTIGVVTAPTGAAVQDIRNIAGRRNPYAVDFISGFGTGRRRSPIYRQWNPCVRTSWRGCDHCRQRRWFDRGPVGF